MNNARVAPATRLEVDVNPILRQIPRIDPLTYPRPELFLT